MFSSNTSQVSEDRLYVEDVFSTYLYAGNGSTQTITNGIDLSGKGGLVWIKPRNTTSNNRIFDTARGALNELVSNTTAAQNNNAASLTSFGSTGFSLGSNTDVNSSSNIHASWTFRKAPKFFDVVTYTGNNTVRNISHNLGVAPGFIIVKPTSTTGNWVVYHRSLGSAKYIILNSTGQEASGATIWGGSDPTSTAFSVGTSGANNQTGVTYVAYLFAHDTTSDGIIQCGSYTGNGSATGPTVTLGWEPQWLLVKDATSAWDWRVVDNMRGMPVGSGAASLFPNLTNAEFTTSTVAFSPTATGFQVTGSAAQINTSGNTYIYIAIRRGPMRTPTTGTSVFSPNAVTSPVGTKVTTGFPVDLQITKLQRDDVPPNVVFDRLRGVSTTTTERAYYLSTNATDAEDTSSTQITTRGFDNTGFLVQDWYSNESSIYWNFRRAPSFMDVVCYSGTGVAGQTINHNLGVAPELIIIKKRSASSTLGWLIGTAFTSSGSKQLYLNNTDAASNTTYNGFITSRPTASAFNVSAYTDVGASGQTYVAYLFGSAPGVSKVGSYTGNGSSQTIDCGFSGGARFVMIKRTSSAGDWYVWDTARGIVAGNDPHLSLNTTAAEVTTDDSVDTDSSGFVVNQLSATNINVSSATYIYLAVA